mmetsp:Transcript_143023/g.202310  ORF Transcript_143023/g.202310 Transcript_143023/m.202310 type:complete len:202 (-) Transcript_143023:125-730(-)
MFGFRAVSVAALLCGAAGTTPRPPFVEYVKVARWLVRNSDYAVSSTSCASERLGCAFKGQPFGDIMSIADGNDTVSTGIVYTYLPPEDAATQDILADPRMTLTFSEKAIGCKSTAEDPPCARLTIAGKLTEVPAGAETDMALSYLFAKHPEMKGWGKAHSFKPYWMAKENISSFFLIDFYGGAKTFTVEEYLASPQEQHLV